MTEIQISLLRPAADGTTEGVAGYLEAVPTRARNVGDDLILPKPFRVRLGYLDAVTEEWVDDGSATVTVAPTVDGVWAWKFYGKGLPTWWKAVPDVESVAFTALVNVAPASLDPAVEPEAAWYTVLDATVEAAVAAYLIENPPPVTSVDGKTGAVSLSDTYVALLVWDEETATYPTRGTAGMAIWRGPTDPTTISGSGFVEDVDLWAVNAMSETPVDTTAPTVPADLTATAMSSSTVDLSWTASTDAVGVTGYEYRIDGGTAVDAGDVLAATVSGLTAATEYDFEVRAYDAAANVSAWSTVATATTDGLPTGITDSFDRANSTTTMGTTDTGETWTPISGTWGISSNKGYRSSTESAGTYAVVEWGISDMAVTAVLTDPVDNAYPGLIARVEDASNLYRVSAHTGALVVYRGATALTSAIPYTYGQTLTMSVEEVGGATRVTIIVDGVQVYTTDDAMVGRPAGTKAGLYAYRNGARFENFAVAMP